MERIYIKDLSNFVGQEVIIKGWVDNRRDHGKLIFLDIRDISGFVQAVALPNNEETRKKADNLRPEWIVEIGGQVNERPAKMINPDQENGHLEMSIEKIEVINKAETLPFDIESAGHEINEEIRLKYRYLDLRRKRLKKNIINRHQVFKFIRDYLDQEGFVEIETPILSKSTPEGARDYVVPSRIDKGSFYALPQSPQQYKQLLMVAGFEKYFQFARCLRDEDTRGDRQPEFTQLDMEMSFVTQEDILSLIEGMFTEMIKKIYPHKKISQKPWPRLDHTDVMEKYGTDKPDIRKDKNDPNELAFCWIVNFPLFEAELTDGHFAPEHHMFTAPKEEDVAKLDTDPALCRSQQHDLVLNGYEVGGGSIRIHNPAIQRKIFDLIGFDEKDKQAFEHMLTAFRYGVPPHGGIAPGMDRLLMILENEPNIREVMAFPKTGEGRDLMMNSPAEISKEQLKELGLK
ncbi:MAG TPA: aspartate--tRNA ligase [Candidatus Vogelbacteria bacterium]|nr:aspartate--tRNA ligase [Candidatus Vogelbacteria bacterium]